MREWETRIQGKPSSRLVSLGGLMTLVGGGMLVAIPLLHRASLLASSELADDVIFDVVLYGLVVVALFLVPTGMVGFHALQMRNYGLIGHIGFWTVVIASMVLALGLSSYLRWENSALLWLVSPMGALGLLVGFILYGAATRQARVLPRWCGMAFIVVLPAAIALVWIRPFFGLGEGASTTLILGGLAWLSLGYVLWTQREKPVEHPSRMR